MLKSISNLKILASYLEEAGGISITRWNMMNSKERKEYVEKHPHSKYATWDMFKKDINNDGYCYNPNRTLPTQIKPVEKKVVAEPKPYIEGEVEATKNPQGKEYKLEDAIKVASDFMSKEPTRYYLGGIHYLNEDYIEATDGHCLIRIKTKVPKNLIGKVINPKTKEEVDGSYPDSDRVFPKQGSWDNNYRSYDFNDLIPNKKRESLESYFNDWNSEFKFERKDEDNVVLKFNSSRHYGANGCLGLRKYITKAFEELNFSDDEKEDLLYRNKDFKNKITEQIKERAKDLAIENEDFNHIFSIKTDYNKTLEGALSSELYNKSMKAFKKLKITPDSVFIGSSKDDNYISSPFVFSGDGVSILTMPIRI